MSKTDEMTHFLFGQTLLDCFATREQNIEIAIGWAFTITSAIKHPSNE